MIIKYRSFFTTLLLCAGLIFSKAAPLYAQNFDQGLEYYQQKNYDKALTVFNQLKNPEGYLFAGKSLYALGQYDEARANLNNVKSDVAPSIFYETIYTSALIDFQQKRFGDALSKLHNVANSETQRNLRGNAEDLYQQILGYLTGKQRINAMDVVDEDEIRFELLESGLGKIPYEQAQELYEQFQDQVDADEWKDRADDFSAALRNASRYQNEYGTPDQKLQPPEGTTYSIGMALPKYKPTDGEFQIVKALYFGAVLAVDEFNENSRNAKAYIRFSDTGTSPDGIEPMMDQFSKKYHGDAVVGPLFSDQAKPMIALATDYEIPVIAPLANSDIDVQNSFLFQANPPFRLHGKAMAQYAVNELGYQHFAILADRNTSGTASAEAFREEVENLGGEVTQYFVEPMQNEYEIANYTKRLGSTEDPLDAVYAPFTGQRALTLIDLLVANLQENNISAAVLGSQEYQKVNFRDNKYRNIDIYFSEGTSESLNGPRLSQFKNKYKQKFHTTGNQYSMIGYDVMSFLLDALEKVGNPELLPSELANHSRYNGLVKNFDFNGGNINEAINIMELLSNGEMRVHN